MGSSWRALLVGVKLLTQGFGRIRLNKLLVNSRYSGSTASNAEQARPSGAGFRRSFRGTKTRSTL